MHKGMFLKPVSNFKKIISINFFLSILFLCNSAIAENKQFISSRNQSNPPLKIAVSHFQPPFVMRGANRDLTGFDIDLMLHICKDLQRKCEFIPMRSTQVLRAVASAKVDVGLGAIDIGNNGYNNISYSVPYMLSEYRLLSKNDQQQPYPELSAITDKSIGINENSLAKSAVQQFAISNNIRLVEYNDINKLISALLNNKIDMAVVHSATANYWQNNSGQQLVIKSKPINLGFGLGIPVYSNNKDLINNINVAINRYKNTSEYKQLYLIYFGNFS